MVENVSISCASDHTYFCGLLVTLHSLCAHVTTVKALTLHILDSGLEEAERTTLQHLGEFFPDKHIRVCFHTVDLTRFKDLPPWSGGHAAYARLLLHEILPDEDFTIYTDVDTLWLRDVGELWRQRDARTPLMAVADGSGLSSLSSGRARGAFFAQYGVEIDPANYFCSGLLLINLRALREDGFTERFPQLLKSAGTDWLAFPDQDLYNVLYPVPKTQLLDSLWGEFSTVYGLRGTQLPRVIHYARSAPWKHTTSLSAVQVLWWNWLKQHIGFETLGKDAFRFKWHYYCLKMQFCIKRCRLLFNLLYGISALFNRKVYAKRHDAIFPEARATMIPMSELGRITCSENTIRIIIPIYNAAPFLRETLASLQAQTFTKWECVCVDDGSTDDSLMILQDVAAKDGRFTVLQQANAGPGVARNVGMRGATTTWLFFLDADDLLHPKTLETLLSLQTKEADCVGIGYSRERHALSVEGMVHYNEYPAKRYFESASPRTILSWGRLWRRTCVENVFFPPWTNHEDTAWNLQVLQRLRLEIFLDAPGVWYRPSATSLSVSHTARKTLPRLWRFLVTTVPASKSMLPYVIYAECKRAAREKDAAFLQEVAQLKRECIVNFRKLPYTKRIRLWRMGIK